MMYWHITNGLRRNSRLARSNSKAFSLVEIMVALGILSFAVIPLFGLLPVGLNIFKDAIDTTVQSQIMERLTTLAEQTEFSKIAYSGDNPKGIAAKAVSAADKATPVYYYYDDQGLEIPAAQKANAIYTAAVTYLDQTGIPNGDQAATVSENIITLWVKIYNNKGIFSNGEPVDSRKRIFMLHIANYGRRI